MHSLVLTDIATGWTECFAMPVRNQSLIFAGFAKAASELPFAMLGIDPSFKLKSKTRDGHASKKISCTDDAV